jgi:hypothetical protein
MRHLGTLLAALVIGPLVWTCTAYGQEHAVRAVSDTGDAVRPEDVVRALLLLAAAGLLLGLIASLRVSPVGAAVTGAAYLASYAGLLIAPDAMLELFGHTVSVAGHQADLSIPLRTGTAALLGAMLLVAVGSAGRWRRWPRPAEPADLPAFDPHGALGAQGLSGEAVGLGTGYRYSSRHVSEAHTDAGPSGLSWADIVHSRQKTE